MQWMHFPESISIMAPFEEPPQFAGVVSVFRGEMIAGKLLRVVSLFRTLAPGQTLVGTAQQTCYY